MTAEDVLSWLKVAAALTTVLGLAFSGWNMMLQRQLSQVADHEKRLADVELMKLTVKELEKEQASTWRWKDTFSKEYQDDRLSAVEKFATKSEMRESFDKLDHHLDEIRRSVDRLRDRIENRIKPDA